MKKKLWLFPIITLLLLSGCSSKEDSQPAEAPVAPPQAQTPNDTALTDESAYTDTLQEEAPLSDEAKPLPEFPGTEENFTFDMNGKHYEFKATDTIRLLNYYQNYESSYDSYDCLSLVASCEGKSSRLIAISESEFLEYKLESELVFEGNGCTIYELPYENEEYGHIWNDYYMSCGDFFYELYDADDLITEGADPQLVFETASQAIDTIKEADEENQLSSVEGELIGNPAFDDYRFAFRPSSKYSYTVMYNVNTGNSAFTENGGLTTIYMQIQMQEDGGEPYTVEMEFSPDSYPYIDDEAENTNISFAGYDIYLDTGSIWSGQNYVLLLGTNQILTTLHSDDERFSPEKVQEALNIIFEKM